jgi:tRNA 2-thiouridine synthesizing protein A
VDARAAQRRGVGITAFAEVAAREKRRGAEGRGLCLAGPPLGKAMGDRKDSDADALWDAGDLSCGPLVLELRKRLKAMPGRVLQVTARDTSAPEDLRAWCRITGNEMVRHDPSREAFWIRSRMNWD